MGDALGSGDTLIVLGERGIERKTASAMLAGLGAQMTALQAALTAVTARISALEARPEEVAHFGGSARLPNVAAMATFTVTLSGLMPARAGDVLKAGEAITVNVVGGLPTGVTMVAPPAVPIDGTVVLSFAASVALSSAVPLAWAISALR